MKSKVDIIFRPDTSTSAALPYFEAKVSAGFPSPAGDYEENRLDLNRHLIKNPAATFFVRVTGDSMVGAGIHHDDILVVDRSLDPRDGNVIIAALDGELTVKRIRLDGELTVKRIRIKRKKITLVPENDNFASKEVTPESEFEVWGVVTNVIHSL
jgi:DNA polymerase V